MLNADDIELRLRGSVQSQLDLLKMILVRMHGDTFIALLLMPPGLELSLTPRQFAFDKLRFLRGKIAIGREFGEFITL